VIKYKYFFLVICLLGNIQNVSAQLYEFGFDAGFVSSKISPKVNRISDDVFLREGRSEGGYTVGIHYSVGQPKNQNKIGWNPRYWVMAELSGCRCGGNYLSTTTNIDGTKFHFNQSFVFYRVDFGGKFILGIKKLRLLVGPTVTKVVFAGYEIQQQKGPFYSVSSDYEFVSVGYELGLGIAYRKIGFSLRYQSAVTNFGQYHNGIPVGIKNSNIKLMLSYKLKEKHKGAYWDSINWAK
jgi:hypothetical protein